MTAQEPFEVHIDLDERCVFIVMRGLWREADLERFYAALEAAEKEMRQLEGTTYALVDAREFPLQDIEIAERFGPLTASLAIPQTRRTALVVPHAIERTQSRQAAEIVNARYFRTLESARDWLFSDEA